MKIGVPREIKNNEYRVAITPGGVRELVRHGHEVYVEHQAGLGSSIPDEDFIGAGAKILETADDVWDSGELILKVKEPIADEYHRMRKGQILFTYLHLAASRPCTQALLDSGVTSVAYETVQLRTAPAAARPDVGGGRPARSAGRRVQPDALQRRARRAAGRRAGRRPGQGRRDRRRRLRPNAAQVAVGMGADVTIMDINVDRLRQIDAIYQGRLKTLVSNVYEIEQAVLEADLVIGAVLIPGAKAPKLVSNHLVSRMKPGSVLVDIAIDQGGCFEDSRPTTHAEPTYTVHDSIFYCVANMPGSVPNTSTYALTNVTLPYAIALAGKGWRQAARDDKALALGLSTHEGRLVSLPVAEAHGLDYVGAGGPARLRSPPGGWPLDRDPPPPRRSSHLPLLSRAALPGSGVTRRARSFRRVRLWGN